MDLSLSGQYFPTGKQPEPTCSPQGHTAAITVGTRMADKLRKEPASNNTAHDLFWGKCSKNPSGHSIITSTEDEGHLSKNVQGHAEVSSNGFKCPSLKGTVSSCIPLVPWSHWHLRYFQSSFLVQWRKRQLSQTMLLTAVMRRTMHWWTNPENLSRPSLLGFSLMDHNYVRRKQTGVGSLL